MSNTAQNTAKPSLAVEVFLALDEIQALGPRLQYMDSWSAPKTAIIWREGKLCYEGFTAIEQVHFTGELVDLTEAPTDEEDYLDLLESQLEALLAPLSAPSLSWQQVEDFVDDLLFRDDLSDEDLLWVIELLQEERDISTTLSTARDHLRLI